MGGRARRCLLAAPAGLLLLLGLLWPRGECPAQHTHDAYCPLPMPPDTIFMMFKTLTLRYCILRIVFTKIFFITQKHFIVNCHSLQIMLSYNAVLQIQKVKRSHTNSIIFISVRVLQAGREHVLQNIVTD